MKEPSTPGPTISRSWLSAAAAITTARPRPATNGNSSGAPSSCRLCAVAAAAAEACLCCCGGTGEALKGLRAVLCLAGQRAAVGAWEAVSLEPACSIALVLVLAGVVQVTAAHVWCEAAHSTQQQSYYRNCSY
eukprot:GHRQ01021247.1.p1 GENE.GHRQ01021247.1~~GHRQ01021247.1.p1  ORF type:complete len:133 (-),score=37.30 GHRQ01021247.1:147-545(-)